MNKLFQLLRNEQMKLYLLRSTWIMLAILTVLLIGSGLLANKFVDEDPRIQTDEWRDALIEENKSFIQDMEEHNYDSSFNHYTMMQNEYYLENDIQPTHFGAIHFVYDNSMFILLISLFTIIVAAGTVANEHRWGTIKLLLIRPISRSTILLSKYISVLLFAITMTVFTFISSFIIGFVFFGFEGANPQTLIETTDGAFELVPLWSDTFAMYLYPLIEIVILATLALMISTIFKSSSMALGTTLFLMFTGTQLVFWFEKYGWSKYILFAHTDLSQYSKTGDLFLSSNTLSFSLIVIAVYYAIFIALSWLFFTRRDISGQ